MCVLESGGNEMMRVVRSKRMIATLLSVVLILGTFGSLSVGAQKRYSRDYNRRPRHSRAKGAGVLIRPGGGTGYLIQRHRNQRRDRRHYSRY